MSIATHDPGPHNRPVALAVDRDPDDGLLLFALREATLRRAPLRLIHVRHRASLSTDFAGDSAQILRQDPLDPDAAGHQVLEAIGGRLTTLAREYSDSAPTIEIVLAVGDVARAVARQSLDAQTVIIGVDAGLGRWIAGRTALGVALISRAPVIVVRGPGRPGPVGIAIPREGASHHAIHEAFAAADRRGTSVRAIRATEQLLADDELPPNRSRDDADIAEILAGHRDEWPDIEVETVIHAGAAKWALLEESERLSVLVVGSSAHGPVIGALLGSVAVAMLHHAECPVVIVPTSMS
jgi:nucleotide-binding universal stress UspA family protein